MQPTKTEDLSKPMTLADHRGAGAAWAKMAEFTEAEPDWVPRHVASELLQAAEHFVKGYDFPAATVQLERLANNERAMACVRSWDTQHDEYQLCCEAAQWGKRMLLVAQIATKPFMSYYDTLIDRCGLSGEDELKASLVWLSDHYPLERYFDDCGHPVVSLVRSTSPGRAQRWDIGGDRGTVVNTDYVLRMFWGMLRDAKQGPRNYPEYSAETIERERTAASQPPRPSGCNPPGLQGRRPVPPPPPPPPNETMTRGKPLPPRTGRPLGTGGKLRWTR